MATTTAENRVQTERLAPVLFTATIFLSASLLFFVQPLFAKIVLPVIGGAPAVWTVAMLFFQSVLIAGYLYAHLSTRYLPIKAQVVLHTAIWGAALFFLPPELPENWRLNAAEPVALQTLGLFALGIGAPFALLSSNAPLIQSWYARSGGPSADDPYFLYGASNLGSLLALLAFPLVAERYFGAGTIAFGFSVGFFVLGFGLLASGGLIAGRQAQASAKVEDSPAPAIQDYLFWALLAFVPSSLMLAVTSKISTDVGAVPLVWVIPLALYLLTFVLTFSARTVFQGAWLTKAGQLSAVLCLCLFVGVAGDHLSGGMSMVLIASFFVVALWAHRRLYEARPRAQHLTIFYVTMSVGGALGGLFNSILAPSFFADLIEGQITLAIVLALAFKPMLGLTAGTFWRGVLIGGALGFAASGTALAIDANAVSLGILIGTAALMAMVAARKSPPTLVVALALIAVLPVWIARDDDRLFSDRSFFGLHQVLDRDGARIYSNGTTVHGAQSLQSDQVRPTPSAYYHSSGPMGQVLYSSIGIEAQSVGVVGLGVGALACHARAGQNWHFYEIDAMVDRVARDTSMFTFLSSCAPDAPTHLGDARVVLAEQSGFAFDVLFLDAYSSNAVPVHLTTREAMALYLDRLAPTGVLVFHISNRYYDIGLPLARSAEALGLHIWRQYHNEKPADAEGFRPSDVVIIARDPSHAAPVLQNGRWTKLASDGGAIWTDDKANPLSILKPDAFR
ncbi:MAG: transporter [Silicimonas sp.]|nr:transporter [Silicimonas sp.]